jgi:hypothetical protein
MRPYHIEIDDTIRDIVEDAEHRAYQQGYHAGVLEARRIFHAFADGKKGYRRRFAYCTRLLNMLVRGINREIKESR